MFMYSLYDAAAKGYCNPIPFPTDDLAKRSLQAAAQGGDPVIAKYPNEYSLWKVGFFHPETGVMEGSAAPERVCFAHELLTKVSVQQLSSEASK